MKLRLVFFILINFVFLVNNCYSSTIISVKKGESTIIDSKEAFTKALKAATPGDSIILANENWKDTELKIAAIGTLVALIYIIEQEKGKVIFEGQSNIKMGGEYLHLEELVFKNGYTPSSSVISL